MSFLIACSPRNFEIPCAADKHSCSRIKWLERIEEIRPRRQSGTCVINAFLPWHGMHDERSFRHGGMVTNLRCCLFSVDRLSLRWKQSIHYLCHLLTLPNVVELYQIVQLQDFWYSHYSTGERLQWSFSRVASIACLFMDTLVIECSYLWIISFHISWQRHMCRFCLPRVSVIVFSHSVQWHAKDVNLLSSTWTFFLCHPTLTPLHFTCPSPFLPFPILSWSEGDISPWRCNFILEQNLTSCSDKEGTGQTTFICPLIDKPLQGQICLGETN